MPRTRKAKQTRLSFTPVAPAQDPEPSQNDTQDRRANVRFSHPSNPTIRNGQTGSTRRSGRSERKPSPEPVKSSDDEQSLPELDTTPQRNQVEEQKERPKAADDSDSDLEIKSSATKMRGKRLLKRKRSSSKEEEEKAQPPEESGAEEIAARPRRKLRRKGDPPSTIVLDDSEDSDDEPVASSPVKRGRHKIGTEAPQTPRRSSNQDQLDLEEDLEDLQDSVVKDTRTRGRFANSARAKRQEHLEALRRRRAGEKVDEEPGPEAQEEPGSDEGGSEDDSEDGSQSEKEKSVPQPRFRLQKEDSDVESAMESNEDLDRYEEDFISEDDDDKLGVPTEDIPLEFTRHAYKQPKEYFRDAVEWMVHNKLNPAFPRSDPLYEVAFTKLEDEVKGRTGSQLISSVWKADFCRALMARPHMEITAYPTIENHPCDACKRSGHPASSDIKFIGKAYSLETLEPLLEDDSNSDSEQSNDDSDSEKSNENDGVERDRDGNVLPDENQRFLLGRHCKTKASMAHTLTHWRFHLNEWVVDHLDRIGYLEDEKVIERSHWSQKRQTRHAIKAVDQMVKSGEVQKLWRDFHLNLKAAREQKQLRW